MAEVLAPEEAKKRVLAGKPLGDAYVDGCLNLAGERKLKKLPSKIRAYQLDLSDTEITTLPADTLVDCEIILRNCRNLESLPDKLKTGTLDLRNCSALEQLPEGLNVWFLDIQGCHALTSFPKRGKIQNGGVNLRGLGFVSTIPGYVNNLSTLDVSDCDQLAKLPPKLNVGLWIDVGGSGLKELPDSLQGVALRWRGVPVEHRVAFHPETITTQEIAEETNAEIRRVKIEQMGMERYIEEVGAKTLNRDTDPGGKRELLKIKVDGSEDIVCLSCSCPSTGRHYLLRVPPNMKTCHQAAAWMAGFDNPDDYKPVLET